MRKAAAPSFDDMHDSQVTPTRSKEQLRGHACNISPAVWRNTQLCSSGPGDEIEADTKNPRDRGVVGPSGSWVPVLVGGMNSAAKQTLSWVDRAL